MTVVLENLTIPERGILELHLNQSIEIKVTAEEARRKVNRWLLDYVSYMMHADPPTFVVDGAQAVWRVPAILTASSVGVVGTVGLVEVDVKTGMMNNSDDRKEQILQCAHTLATKLPPYQSGHRKAPEQFIPKHIPRAKMAELPADDDE